MDKIDRKILALLQEDATLSHQALADRVGASAASCWRRIKSLEVIGIITRTVRLVDQLKVGLSVTVL
ncbi:MAG: Lrp/AsnC family transcriptional regulator [Sphingorhabdus sp.]